MKLSSRPFVWHAQGLGWIPETTMVPRERVSRRLTHQPSEATKVVIHSVMLLLLVPHRRRIPGRFSSPKFQTLVYQVYLRSQSSLGKRLDEDNDREMVP